MTAKKKWANWSYKGKQNKSWRRNEGAWGLSGVKGEEFRIFLNKEKTLLHHARKKRIYRPATREKESSWGLPRDEFLNRPPSVRKGPAGPIRTGVRLKRSWGPKPARMSRENINVRLQLLFQRLE